MKINGVEIFDTIWGDRAPTEAQERAYMTAKTPPAAEQPAQVRRTVPAFPPVRRLICCCCGETTRGRQWWNRDTGYGLCPACAARISKTKWVSEMRDQYGIDGTHYNLPTNGGTP